MPAAAETVIEAVVAQLPTVAVVIAAVALFRNLTKAHMPTNYRM